MSALTRDHVYTLRERAMDLDVEASDLRDLAETAELASLSAMRQRRDLTVAASFERTAAGARALAATKDQRAEHAWTTAEGIEDVLDRTEGFRHEDPRWGAFWSEREAQDDHG